MKDEEEYEFGAQSRLNDSFSFETLRLLRQHDFKTFNSIKAANKKDKNFMYSLLELKHPGLIERASKAPKKKRPKVVPKKLSKKPKVVQKVVKVSPRPILSPIAAAPLPPVHSVKSSRSSKRSVSPTRGYSERKKKSRKRSRSSSSRVSKDKRKKKKSKRKEDETEEERRIRKRREKFGTMDSSRSRSRGRRR